MLDWLTFQAPFDNNQDLTSRRETAPTELNNLWKKFSKCLAQFAISEGSNNKIKADTIIVNYGFKREFLIYNFMSKQIVRTLSLQQGVDRARAEGGRRAQARARAARLREHGRARCARRGAVPVRACPQCGLRPLR